MFQLARYTDKNNKAKMQKMDYRNKQWPLFHVRSFVAAPKSKLFLYHINQTTSHAIQYQYSMIRKSETLGQTLPNSHCYLCQGGDPEGKKRCLMDILSLLTSSHTGWYQIIQSLLCAALSSIVQWLCTQPNTECF